MFWILIELPIFDIVMSPYWKVLKTHGFHLSLQYILAIVNTRNRCYYGNIHLYKYFDIYVLLGWYSQHFVSPWNIQAKEEVPVVETAFSSASCRNENQNKILATLFKVVRNKTLAEDLIRQIREIVEPWLFVCKDVKINHDIYRNLRTELIENGNEVVQFN